MHTFFLKTITVKHTFSLFDFVLIEEQIDTITEYTCGETQQWFIEQINQVKYRLLWTSLRKYEKHPLSYDGHNSLGFHANAASSSIAAFLFIHFCFRSKWVPPLCCFSASLIIYTVYIFNSAIINRSSRMMCFFLSRLLLIKLNTGCWGQFWWPIRLICESCSFAIVFLKQAVFWKPGGGGQGVCDWEVWQNCDHSPDGWLSFFD